MLFSQQPNGVLICFCDCLVSKKGKLVKCLHEIVILIFSFDLLLIERLISSAILNRVARWIII